MTTREVIHPILAATYGQAPKTDDLADLLAERIDENDFDERGREHRVREICWMWFSGGSTAASVAHRIEEALAPQQEDSR